SNFSFIVGYCLVVKDCKPLSITVPRLNVDLVLLDLVDVYAFRLYENRTELICRQRAATNTAKLLSQRPLKVYNYVTNKRSPVSAEVFSRLAVHILIRENIVPRLDCCAVIDNHVVRLLVEYRDTRLRNTFTIDKIAVVERDVVFFV